MTTGTKSQFDRAYDDIILGRTFVEYRDYYSQVRPRIWRSFEHILRLDLPRNPKVVDIGGGILGVMLHRLLGAEVVVLDVSHQAEEDLREIGIDFELGDIYRDILPAGREADLVVFTEVIEHIPEPPYIVLRRLEKLVRPGGYLFLTTPNGHRFRNLLYMAAGKEILGFYRLPEPGQALGHQHEYTMKQMKWQVAETNYIPVFLEYYEAGFKGATPMARIAHKLTAVATLVPHWRSGLVIALQRPR